MNIEVVLSRKSDDIFFGGGGGGRGSFHHNLTRFNSAVEIFDFKTIPPCYFCCFYKSIDFPKVRVEPAVSYKRKYLPRMLGCIISTTWGLSGRRNAHLSKPSMTITSLIRY